MHRPKRTKISNMSSVQHADPGVPKGFPNIPHIPLPPEHSVGTNEATMAPTPENPESWHNRQRPREICIQLEKDDHQTLHGPGITNEWLGDHTAHT